MEGHNRNYVDDVVQQIGADAKLVEGYLDGSLKRTTTLSHEQALLAPARSFAIRLQYEQEVLSGSKTVEGRINDGEAEKVKAGDTIILGSTRSLVKQVRRHSNFRDMLERHGVEKCLQERPPSTMGSRSTMDSEIMLASRGSIELWLGL